MIVYILILGDSYPLIFNNSLNGILGVYHSPSKFKFGFRTIRIITWENFLPDIRVASMNRNFTDENHKLQTKVLSMKKLVEIEDNHFIKDNNNNNE